MPPLQGPRGIWARGSWGLSSRGGWGGDPGLEGVGGLAGREVVERGPGWAPGTELMLCVAVLRFVRPGIREVAAAGRGAGGLGAGGAEPGVPGARAPRSLLAAASGPPSAFRAGPPVGGGPWASGWRDSGHLEFVCPTLICTWAPGMGAGCAPPPPSRPRPPFCRPVPALLACRRPASYPRPPGSPSLAARSSRARGPFRGFLPRPARHELRDHPGPGVGSAHGSPSIPRRTNGSAPQEARDAGGGARRGGRCPFGFVWLGRVKLGAARVMGVDGREADEGLPSLGETVQKEQCVRSRARSQVLGLAAKENPKWAG